MLLNIYCSYSQSWNILGEEEQVSSQSSSYTSVAIKGKVPYVAFREGGSIGIVKYRNPQGVWVQLGDDFGTNITHCRLYVDKSDVLFVAYVDVVNGNKLAVKKYNTATQLWEPINNDANNLYLSEGSVTNSIGQYSSTARFSLAFDSGNVPYVAFCDAMTPYVKKFDGSGWVTVGSGAVSGDIAVAPSLVIDETDAPYFVYMKLGSSTSSTGVMALYKYDAGNWGAITSPVTQGIRHVTMGLNATNNLSIAYFNTSRYNRATVINYNKTSDSWSSATELSSRDATDINLLKDAAGNVYCSFVDKYDSRNYYQVARVRKLEVGTSSWVELKDQLVDRGIDEPTGNLTIGIGTDTDRPYIVYTKRNSNAITVPVVRQYALLAELSTIAASNITSSSVQSGGDITDDRGATITERGIVYSTTLNPTIDDNKIVDTNTGAGMFNLTISGLDPASIYYLRAYAVSAAGLAYGDNIRVNTLAQPDAVVTAPKQMEVLNRGLVAVRTSSNTVYIGWRWLGTEPSSTGYNVYRDGVLVNDTPITESTNLIDETSTDGTYVVKPVLNGEEGLASEAVTVWAKNQLYIPIQIPAGGVSPDGVSYTYSANDCSVGDMDGDGKYEIVVRWEPSNKSSNSGGFTGNQIFDCYKMDGTRLWRIDLGINMVAGDHYNQFMVYDLDGDGKAEVALKTADGTIDGLGHVIGDPNVDYRNEWGWVHDGPEFLTIFNGMTGEAMATAPFEPARGNISDWGDNYGNRADRFVHAVAYLDGERPSLIMGRGYYNKLARAAYNWRDGKLTLLWKFDSKDPGNEEWSGMGNHHMTIGDVDGDGKDEIINGSSAINDNGQRLWSNGYGHGDALHMTDMDLSRPGMEEWVCLENPGQYDGKGLRLNSAKDGTPYCGVNTSGDVGRAMAADIDPNHPGYELWGSSGNLYDVNGNQIATNKPTYNFGIWWNGDLGRELLDGSVIDRWNYETQSLNRVFTVYKAASISTNNSTKKNPCLQADLLGDWREEILYRLSDNSALVLFTTTAETNHRIYTLMHDPQYRTAIAWQNSAYNQPPYPSFYLGYGMPEPPTPNIIYPEDNIPPVAIAQDITVTLVNGEATVSAEEVNNGSYDAYGIKSLELSQTTFYCSNIGENRVTLTVTDANGLTATADANVTVIGDMPEQPEILVSRTDNTYTGVDDNTILLGYGAQELTLDAVTGGSEQYTYEWEQTTGLSVTDLASTVFTPTEAGIYTLTVTVTNSYGCTSTADVEITVVDVRCGENNDKVTVCHSGKAICLDVISVQDHLMHGDNIGECDSESILKSATIGGEDAETDVHLEVFPNPMVAKGTIRVALPEGSKIQLQLYDANGRAIKHIYSGYAEATSTYSLETSNLPIGVYYVQLVSDENNLSTAIVVQ